jgi:hypothetical protein
MLDISCMSGIFKSSCRVWFETYHGAPDIIRSVLDWKDWSILVFDGLLQPRNSIYRMSILVWVCVYRWLVCFPKIVWMYGLVASTYFLFLGQVGVSLLLCAISRSVSHLVGSPI